MFRLVQHDPQQRIVCRLVPHSELEGDAEMWVLAEHLLAPEWRLLHGHDAPDASAHHSTVASDSASAEDERAARVEGARA